MITAGTNACNVRPDCYSSSWDLTIDINVSNCKEQIKEVGTVNLFQYIDESSSKLIFSCRLVCRQCIPDHCIVCIWLSTREYLA